MIDESRLRLYEGALLLALDDRKGSTVAGAHPVAAMAGAIVAELLLLGRIRLEQRKKKHLIQVADSRFTGDPLLDECFQRIRSAKQPQSPSAWVKRFALMPRLRHRVAERLWLAGLLRKEERTVLLFFKRIVYPAQDARPKARLRDKLRSALLTDDPIDDRTRMSIAVVRHTLLACLLDRPERKARFRKIKVLTKNDPIADAIRDARMSEHGHS